MPSPFPGMDPYLESPDLWGSFHQMMTTFITLQLNGKLPSCYLAVLDEYVWLVDEPEDDRKLLGRPDVFVTPRRGPKPWDEGAGGVVVAVEMAAPTIVTKLAKSKPKRKSYVKIVTARVGEVLTVIELLSPSNKQVGADRAAYLAKRSEYLATKVNLIEIDLLRGGDRLPFGKPQPPVTDYYFVVCPRDRPATAQRWAFGLRERMPTIPVPVREGVPPVSLDLRACLDQCYDGGRYRGQMRYDSPADPPLGKDDAEWAAKLLESPPTTSLP